MTRMRTRKRTTTRMRMEKMLMLLTCVAIWGRAAAAAGPGVEDRAEPSWASATLAWASGAAGLLVALLACACCKKTRGAAFKKELRNVPDGEAYQARASSPASPDVYVLPLGEVALPLARRAPPPAHHLKWSHLSRQSLLYLKEIGTGWFGKVLLGEVNENLRTNQVVVKELKASASVKEQMRFLEEVQPYRVLRHSSLLQCLAQCTDVAPFLLIMEFCPLGDVKAYLRNSADGGVPEPLILQRMACDIASGLKHLHAHNFAHSDLALRNCLLTADVTVKIGDYGLSRCKYKDDYMVTAEQTYVPLRWIAPELVDDVHGSLLVAKQTRQSNIWSLGVTIWELLELGKQPYSHYSDRQVLSYAVREQQLRLAKPALQVPLAERWYEVMQFCWLPPDQRPNAEEVHLLLSYLCAKGASEAEEDFERRWNSMRPGFGHNVRGAPRVTTQEQPSVAFSFPLLRQFAPAENYHPESGDDVLTITETSHGLNFEYRWEQARAEESYRSPDSASGLSPVQRHEAFYPPAGMVGSCPLESHSHRASPSFYEPMHLHAPGVLPVFSAHSPSVNSEFYIRIEEPVDCDIEPDYTMCSFSPDYRSSGSFLTGSADSGDCVVCPSQAKTRDTYWSADIHNMDSYGSNDSSPAISLTMEPLLGQVCDSSPLRPWESSHYVSYKDRDGGYYYEHSPPVDTLDHYLMGGELAAEQLQESWGSRSLRQALSELENPGGIQPSLNSPSEQVYRDSYLDLDTSRSSVIGKTVTGGYYDMMGSLRKTMPSRSRSGTVSVNMETERALFLGRGQSDSGEEEEEDVFMERHTCNTWPSKHRPAHQRRASPCCRQETYADFHYTMPSTDIEDSWPEELDLRHRSLPKSVAYLEARRDGDNVACLGVSPERCDALVYLCHQGDAHVTPPRPCCRSHFVDPLTGLSGSRNHNKVMDIPDSDETINLSPAPGGPVVSKPAPVKPDSGRDTYVDLRGEEATRHDIIAEHPPMTESSMEEMTQSPPTPADDKYVAPAQTDPQSETSQAGDSGLDRGGSSFSLTDILDCSDNEDDDITDDVTDMTSGILADESGELSASPAFKSLQKQGGTPDSVESIDLAPVSGPCEGSGTALRPSCSPKAMDSGYDTENYESPEFVPKEPHEAKDQAVSQPAVHASLKEDCGVGVPENKAPCEDVSSRSCDHTFSPLSQETPYRDSAYFSDYENERQIRKEEEEGCQTKDGCENEDEEVLKDTVIPPGRVDGEDCFPELSGTRETEDRAADDLLDGSTAEGSLDEWPSQEEGSSLEDWAAEVVVAMEEALDALNGEQNSAGVLEKEGGKVGPVKDKPFGPEAFHSLPKDEVALQQAANSRRSSASSPPPQPAGRGSPDGDETDREDGDSDVSTDSDEEMPRPLDVQEEESEDECHPVPIVVSDDSHAHMLRGLLKTPALLELHQELQREKRNVSFFDDVTVYLFDQESPTKELTAHGFPLAVEGSCSKSPEKVIASDDSSDGNISEESAGFEWEDDFPLLPLPTSSAASDSPSCAAAVAQEIKSAARFSRFTVSPSGASRFSITHISDSDMDSAGGSSEDGDKE